MNSLLGTLRPSSLLAPNSRKSNTLFGGLRRRKSEPLDSENEEYLLHSLLLFSVLIHIADIRNELGDSWDAFAAELLALQEPCTAVNSETVSCRQLCEAVDAVVDKCRSCPEAQEIVEHLVSTVEALTGNVALPVEWKAKEDLMTNISRLHDYLERGEKRTSALEGARGSVEVPVWYGTCRQLSGNNAVEAFYGTERADELSMGLVRVSIPDFDDLGNERSDLPYGWFWDRGGAATRKDGVAITKVVPMDDAAMKRHMSRNKRHTERLLRGRKRGGRRGWEKAQNEACIYVHGFKFKFSSAARKMALWAYKMQEDAPLFMFSWPSYEAFDSYSADEGNAMWAVAPFVDFLKKMLTEFHLDKVHIMGHSMGSRVILYGLERLASEVLPEGAAKLGRLVLAAPDFDLGEFCQMQQKLSKMVEHITIYGSSNDQALHISSRIHGGHPRLGTFPTNPGTRPWHVPFCENIDVINASGLDKTLLGHTYIFSVPSVITDAICFLRDGVSAERRSGLKASRTDNGFRYFAFQGPSDDAWIDDGDMDEVAEAEEVETFAEFGQMGAHLPENSQKKLSKFFGAEL